jgi:hypothetical protein
MSDIFWEKCLRFHLAHGYTYIYRISSLSFNNIYCFKQHWWDYIGFKGTFNNISVILSLSVLLKPEYLRKPVACHWQTLSHNASSTPRLSGIYTHNINQIYRVICSQSRLQRMIFSRVHKLGSNGPSTEFSTGKQTEWTFFGLMGLRTILRFWTYNGTRSTDIPTTFCPMCILRFYCYHILN